MDRIDQAARGARLLAISFVNYLSGFRANLEAIGEVCARRGVFFFVDAIQGLGAIPLDVNRMRIDALAADGHKWLLGPEGCGLLYLRRERLDEVEPVEFGWTTVAGYANYANRDLTLRPDAGRYECGTLNTIGCFGLRAAIELLLEIGPEHIEQAVLELTDTLAEGAAARGYQIMAERGPGTSSGIVSIRREGIDSRLVVRQLRDAGMLAAPRQGWARIAPHFYIGRDEMERVVAALL
jgi:selenocysteine lyase/cysteine desulfurase